MSCTVKMTQLPAHTNKSDIRHILRDIGVVRHVEVFKSGYAIVELGNAKEAREAAMRKHKHKLFIGDCQIRVKVVWTPRDTLSSIRVSNLAHGTTEETVAEIFSAHGEIVNVRVGKCMAKGRKEKEQGNWAEVTFAKIDYACKACFSENGAVLPSAPCGLNVVLVHPDAKNLKWRQNQNQFKYCPLKPRVEKEEEKHSQEKPTVDGYIEDDASTVSFPMSSASASASPSTSPAHTPMYMSGHAPAHAYFGRMSPLPRGFNLQSHTRVLDEIAWLQEKMCKEIGLPIKAIGPFERNVSRSEVGAVCRSTHLPL